MRLIELTYPFEIAARASRVLLVDLVDELGLGARAKSRDSPGSKSECDKIRARYSGYLHGCLTGQLEI